MESFLFMFNNKNKIFNYNKNVFFILLISYDIFEVKFKFNKLFLIFRII